MESSTRGDSIAHLDALLRSMTRDDGALDLVRSLCDDVGPRFPCTAADAAAITWAKDRLHEAGLANVRTEVAPATLWERGTESCDLFLPRRQAVSLTALGGSVGTDGAGVDAPVVEFASIDALDRASPAAVAGKIVFLHHVMERRRDGTAYHAAAPVRMRGPSHAARQGAVACLVRSIGTDTSRAPHTGALFYESGAPMIPAAALSVADAALLHRALARGGEVHAKLTLGCRPLPVGESANVLAELPGTDKAEDIVLLGAHLDSWDLGTGALDDGTGCAIAIAVAGAIAALPERPRRTLRIVLFANEELGIGGGLAYARAHASEASRHVVAMEADQGDGVPWGVRVPAGALSSTLASRIHAALAPLGVELDPGTARGGVDISPLRQLGVPVVDLRQDATRYFDFHHTANDVFENVSPNDLRAAAAAFAATIWILCNAEERFGDAQPTRP